MTDTQIAELLADADNVIGRVSTSTAYFPHGVGGQTIDAAARAKIDQTVEAAIARRLTPSCCVVIGTSKDILFAKAYGRLTYDLASPAATLSVADAVEIAQTCQLAGRADLIAGFLEANTAPAKVRSQLLSAKAEASPEIVSRIAPDASRPAPANPLLEAARNLAAQSSALKKEI